MLANFLFFNEPEIREKFTLEETDQERYKSRNNNVFKKDKVLNKSVNSDKNTTEKNDRKISIELAENLEYLKKKYRIPLNSDILLREFTITIGNNNAAAFIIFYDGMTDRKLIDDNILQPLMLLSNLDIKYDSENIATCIKNRLLPHNQITEVSEFDKIISDINFGSCALFVHGLSTAFLADVKGFEHRSVSKPTTELIIRGPQEGFTETLRVNTALIRKRLKDEDLIVENLEIGERSKTPCSLMYVKDIANDSLIQEIKKRLTSIKIDYLNDSGELEQFIEDDTFLPAPQMIATERPDRVAMMLSEGRAAIVVNGSPFVLVVPITFFDLIHSTEDSFNRFPAANLFRFFRLLGIFTALLLPGFYIAVTNFHHEMIPTSLLLAVEASREKVPFPSIIEILLMEASFELIREAGIRIPGPIGPTLGIIGALILGQAAVSANIVSPILIIVVSVTGLGSFAMPDFSLGIQFRILRFVYILLAAASGFLGITTGIFIYVVYLCSAKSFGVPFLAPYGPKTSGGYKYEIYEAPLWKQEERPDYLNTKDDVKQSKISRGWFNTIKNKNKQ